MEKTWNIKGKFEGDIVSSLFNVRKISDFDDFLSPMEPTVIFEQINWELGKACDLIKSHIKKGSRIFIHGDYDVDGICATAILWKTIYFDLGYKKCLPFIPDRFEDGYGLSKDSIDKIKVKLEESGNSKNCLIITVDCGITAKEACDYAKSLGFDVLISDHHQKGEKLPSPEVLLWTDQLVGSGVSLALSSFLLSDIKDEYLALASLATVADLQPLVRFNRSIVKFGLEKLNYDTPLGIKKLMEVSGISGKSLTTYELGWLLSPRLNASGRLESAMDSLKLLCTKNEEEALILAEKLNRTNYERQQKTVEMVGHAKGNDFSSGKIIVVGDAIYHEGVIGLVAGRLVQEFYKPAIVLSIGTEVSKGSARSLEGINIVELLRRLDIFDNLGGHPMAAGFSIKTSRLEEFYLKIKDLARELIDELLLKPSLNVDLEAPISLMSLDVVNELKKFEPYGFGNPEPIFVSRGLEVVDVRSVGARGDHLKMKLRGGMEGSESLYNAIYFGGGKHSSDLSSGAIVDLAYCAKENVFNGFVNLDLVVKDLKIASSV